MNNPQQPREYDAVFGGNSSLPENAAVLGGIEGIKLQLSNSDAKVQIAALEQATNYGEPGLDLVIAALKDKSWAVQNAAYFILNSRTEPRIKQVLQEPHRLGFKLEPIEIVTLNEFGENIQRQQRTARYFLEDLGNGVTLEMAAIPGGSFLMGSPEQEVLYLNESPPHQVSVTSFCMGKYQLTQAQYQAVMESNPSNFKGDNRPVENVSWDNAVTFCQKLSQRTGKNYRLPTEAEWEYACRAGTNTPFYFGETITPDLVNYHSGYPYSAAPKGKFRAQTTDVGSFPPNAFGLYDMHGNVWEWCEDDWHENYTDAPINGSAWFSQSGNHTKIIRGGCWCSFALNCRSADRGACQRGCPSLYYGFRVVLPL